MSRHNGTWAASEIGIKLVRETIHNKGWTQNRPDFSRHLCREDLVSE